MARFFLFTLLCWMGAALFVAGCSDETVTEVVLVIDAEMCVPNELDAVTIEIDQRTGTTLTERVADDEGTLETFPLTLSLVSKVKEGAVTVRVIGELDSARIVTRTAVFSFVEGQRRILPIHLTSACITRSCEADQTCGNDGRCRGELVDRGELLPWSEDSLRGSVPDCVMRDGGMPDADAGTVTPSETCSDEEPCEGDGFHCVFGICADRPWIEHAMGLEHMCSIFNDGTGDVWCRGSNQYGQLGREGPDSHDYVRVDIDPARKVVAGRHHTCALLRDGRVMCWGVGANGQLGRGSLGVKVTWSATPEYVQYEYPNDPITHGVQLDYVTSLSAGEAHVCAAGENADNEETPGTPTTVHDHAAHCWGWNESMQLGQYNEEDSDVAIFVFHGDMINVAAGRHHTCSLEFEEGRTEATGFPVSCWGSNHSYQLSGGFDTSTIEDQLLYRGDVVDDARLLAAASDHNCLVRANGRLLCWGSNEFGESGQDPDEVVEMQMEEVPGIRQIGAVSQIALGDDHTCARISTDAYCFGNNAAGQLLSKGGRTHIPRKIDEDGTVLDVWAGYDRTCVWLEETGAVCSSEP